MYQRRSRGWRAERPVYSGSSATHRTILLALLQPIETDSLPALGGALLELEQGDAAPAVGPELEGVPGELPAAKGGAELRLLAGQLSQARDPRVRGATLSGGGGPGSTGDRAPAELAGAELMLDRRRTEEAVALLEHLILTYPESALVPTGPARAWTRRAGGGA